MKNDDTLKMLGKVIPEGAEVGRDAVHVAVAPVKAGEELKPGQRVLMEGGYAHWTTIEESAVGIVDPFLQEPVRRGQRFWLWLKPGTITSLTHCWTHPAFDASPALREYLAKKISASEWQRKEADDAANG